MPNQNACDTFLENFSHYDIQEMHEVTFHTAQSFIPWFVEARGKAAIHEENSTKTIPFKSEGGAVDDFQPQSRLKPLALSVDSQDGISRTHRCGWLFIGVGVSHFVKCKTTSAWHPSIGI